jgi:class 3 adenylate cyclase/tetratricopeptide (TPR) repeat protein
MQSIHCPDCEARNPAGSKFCNQCGTSLTAPGVSERRQLTVLFSDLVGSTALARALDAESFRDLLNEYQSICRGVVTDLRGHVAQYLGDGVMVYFGYPEAREDDARRAAYAALGIVEQMKALSTRLDLPRVPAVRVGIHTGVVVVAQMGATRQLLALGETPNLASRLQHAAEPNAVVVSASTRTLLADHFRVAACVPTLLSGFPEPVSTYRLIEPTTTPRRAATLGPSAPPPIGRHAELAELLLLWNRAQANGRAVTVLLSGDAGIGKSRQVLSLVQALSAPYQVVEGYCMQDRQNAAFSPFAQALESAAGLGGTVDPELKLKVLERYLDHLGLGEESVETLAPVVGVPLSASSALYTLGLQIRRQRIMQHLVLWLRALAAHTPLLFVLEDLHWADPSTLDFIRDFIDSDVRGPILLVATSRPECELGGVSERLQRLSLVKLSPALAEQLIARAAMGRSLPAAVVDRILDLTDGVPLFIEEVTKAILESGVLHLEGDRYDLAGALPEGLLPATVRDSLAARLDRTGEGRAVAQLAAAMGREFTEEVLKAVALMDEIALDVALRKLVRAGLINQARSERGVVYRFKHALIQEVAYQSLLRSKRQQYHHRIASVLHDQFPEVARAQPDLIAQHHARANLPEQAATYYVRAGSLAFDTQAYVEATSHFENALKQLEKLPAGAHRDSRELEVLSLRGLPLLMTMGYASPAVDAVYTRALELCVAVEPPVRVLYGIYVVHNVRGDREATNRLAHEFEGIAQRSASRAERLIAHAAVGARDFWQGSFADAIQCLEKGVRCFEPTMLATLPRDYGHDNALYGHLMLLWAQVMAGRVGAAYALWEQTWALTESTQAPYLRVMALSFGAAIARDLGDAPRALELSSKGVEMAARYQLVFWLALAHMQHGSALCMSSNVTDGRAEIEAGLRIFRATGASLPLSYYLSYLGEACLLAGATETGLEAVEEGLKLTATNLDRNCEPELLRLKGELLLQRGGDADAAESLLWQSLSTARADGAGLWELRTATSLANLLSARGDVLAAIDVLDAACSRILGAEPPLLIVGREMSARMAASTTHLATAEAS